MISDSYILLDTCILNNLQSKETGLAYETKKLLRNFYNKNNTFAVSEFTHHELLRSIPESKADECKDLLNELITIRNTDERLSRGTRLYSLYKECPTIKNSLHSISDIDVFIGSLIFTEQKPYLLTADYSDFPRPFFHEVDFWNIEFKKRKGGRKIIIYYLFQGDLEVFVD
ncbi:hypothetical protein GF354_06170 [Candidatus Peregrinibacteria bacterium]|nr:hypothetical protein [Candidatus Peregrinibacteria bacterium]